MDCFHKTVTVNLRHNFIPHFILACITAAATPLIYGISSLNSLAAARPLELILPFTGVFLFTPVFYPEQNENIRDLIKSKYKGYAYVCLVRILYSAFALALIIGIFVLSMYIYRSDVTLRHFLGAYASALLLGSVGLFFAGACSNITPGYMAAVIYYIASYSLKQKLGAGCIFSMLLDMDFGYKYGSIALALFITAAGLLAARIR